MKAMPSTLGPRDKRLHQADTMPAALRACVHEYGLAIVTACLKHGVSEPAAIHELVKEIWMGARQTSQRRAPSSTLDWYFSQAGLDISTPTLLRLLKNQNLIICPHMATRQMIDASMATVANFNAKVTKHEKHKLRLDAALEVGARYLLRLAPTQNRSMDAATLSPPERNSPGES
jgi:hypothetical protein